MQEKTSAPALIFHRNGRNLHISLQSEPDTATLVSMSSVLDKYADGSGRLFVDVRGLKETVPQKTINGLRKVLKSSPIPPQSVYFKGPAGFNLAADGNRVIIVRGKDELKQSAPAPQAQSRFVKRAHKCKCGGKCGDQCCQVTGGPCCSEKGHKHEGRAANDA